MYVLAAENNESAINWIEKLQVCNDFTGSILVNVYNSNLYILIGEA